VILAVPEVKEIDPGLEQSVLMSCNWIFTVEADPGKMLAGPRPFPSYTRRQRFGGALPTPSRGPNAEKVSTPESFNRLFSLTLGHFE